MASKTQHPCFECGLPECDDKSKSCALRMVLNRYDNCRRKGLPISDKVRQQNSIAWRELYLPARREREAQRRQAGKAVA
ncbi:MAG: hypothetical protein DI604_23970 [Delftia acidovorans]|nr:MAG: hypothetical protein DI604_23970 [Delftia acidovorans]